MFYSGLQFSQGKDETHTGFETDCSKLTSCSKKCLVLVLPVYKQADILQPLLHHLSSDCLLVIYIWPVQSRNTQGPSMEHCSGYVSYPSVLYSHVQNQRSWAGLVGCYLWNEILDKQVMKWFILIIVSVIWHLVLWLAVINLPDMNCVTFNVLLSVQLFFVSSRAKYHIHDMYIINIWWLWFPAVELDIYS